MGWIPSCSPLPDISRTSGHLIISLTLSFPVMATPPLLAFLLKKVAIMPPFTSFMDYPADNPSNSLPNRAPQGEERHSTPLLIKFRKSITKGPVHVQQQRYLEGLVWDCAHKKIVSPVPNIRKRLAKSLKGANSRMTYNMRIKVYREELPSWSHLRARARTSS